MVKVIKNDMDYDQKIILANIEQIIVAIWEDYLQNGGHPEVLSSNTPDEDNTNQNTDVKPTP